jgi:hypothetical protein
MAVIQVADAISISRWVTGCLILDRRMSLNCDEFSAHSVDYRPLVSIFFIDESMTYFSSFIAP